MKYRGKLGRLMAGPIPLSGGFNAQADYKGRRALKSCLSEFHRILWCGPYKETALLDTSLTMPFFCLGLSGMRFASSLHDNSIRYVTSSDGWMAAGILKISSDGSLHVFNGGDAFNQLSIVDYEYGRECADIVVHQICVGGCIEHCRPGLVGGGYAPLEFIVAESKLEDIKSICAV